MGVVLQFVGAGDAFGTGGRLQACLSLRWDGGHVLLDCGATSLVGLRRLSLAPSSVDAVILSHLHGDHFGGIPFLILDQQFAGRERPLVIAGPTGTAERIRLTMEVLFPGSSTIVRRFRTELVELEPGRASTLQTARGSLDVLPVEVDHASGAPALALRVACGSVTVGYSGDTAWTPALLQVARGTDAFVCEAYSLGRAIRYHLDYATLAANRANLGCRRLVLTHLGPEALAARAELERDPQTIVADDGLLLDL